jgi:hypothetical protein
MTGVIVRTVEELKAAQKRREHPTIIIEGELAGNLIASGIISRENHDSVTPTFALRHVQETKSSPMNSVVRLFSEITRLHDIEVHDGAGGRRIKITPLSSTRRDK